ncbi:hypothetical protein C1646_766203 [Rhizophagus diaphanus]|nr:hypothetical protein C1646_766203 [Rhizophagus diaphanus] [Rhizophagus sp. MUCL 43196]
MPSQKRQKQLRRQRIIRSHFRFNLENTSRLIANLSQQQNWDDGAQEWSRAGPMNVALKLLDNSQNISS